MHKLWIVLLYLAINVTAIAQQQLVWPLLEMTTYQIDDDGSGNVRYQPEYPGILESKFEGEEVAIAGYLIPINIESQTYALSKNPFSSCFFCGGAGPETVIQLKFKEPPGRFATDKFLMIKGVLHLNRSGSGLFFTLSNAEVHG